MKVCFLAGTLGRGGAERQLLYMLRVAREEGIRPTLLCLTSGEPLEKEVRDLGIDVLWVGAPQSRVARLFRVISALRAVRADIVQSSHYYTNIYAAVAARAVGINSIGAVRNNLTSEIAADRFFGRWQAKLPDHLVVNSSAACNRALDLGLDPKRIDVVKNVVDAGPSAAKYRAKNSGEPVKILFVGRLVDQKRPELFVKLASQLRRRLSSTPMSFKVVGDGPLRSRLERTRDRENLSEREISFLGEVEEMSSIYQDADLLILTSDHEGTPNVVLEAMAYGLPVVATSVGGVPEIVNSDCGILVNPGDLEGLIQATSTLILDADLRKRLGRSGRAFVSENHSFGYLRQRLGQVYAKVLRETGN